MVKHRYLQQQIIKQQLAGLQSDLPQNTAPAIQLRRQAGRALLFSSILLASSVTAANETDEGFERQLGSHQHGEAHLDVVLADNQLLISFTTPAANIVGFEHQPRNEAEEQQVATARKYLLDLPGWLEIPAAAGCELTTAELVEADKHDEHDHDSHEENHDEHDHDKHDEHHDEHDHDSHEEHHDEHHDEHDHDNHKENHDGHHDDHDKHDGHHDGHDHAEGETHSDWQFEYALSCKDAARLSHFDIALFGQYPALEEIRVQAVGPAEQSLQELTPDKIRFRF